MTKCRKPGLFLQCLPVRRSWGEEAQCRELADCSQGSKSIRSGHGGVERVRLDLRLYSLSLSCNCTAAQFPRFATDTTQLRLAQLRDFECTYSCYQLIRRVHWSPMLKEMYSYYIHKPVCQLSLKDPLCDLSYLLRLIYPLHDKDPNTKQQL
ncbi:hypothetical protein BO86DRAFT_157647 [Aspergillus japonicus CBS 114.51]|uniref:Uncharacterized protein n=1 Tax=Aspergillus japonicus CBS 114.51 TaxID=1448312 RepID=A0A8T8WTH9_ASPJA|nr:hypothetical protein BO86DRAFT_157647 [Aspergillus japonicus CBS 114.51]RAH79073.1 hypothetical protein BO86DRAFT_157647 [Aspergillus japonicus CBS 114.51]